MATAPRVSRLTDASRLLWMRIRRTDRGEAMLRQALAAVCLFVLPGAAAEVRFDGSYRLRFNGDTNLALEETGFLSGQRHWLEHRLRLTPKIVEIGEKGGIDIQASFAVLSGIFAGDFAPDFRSYGPTQFSARNSFTACVLDFRHPFARLRMPVG